MIARCLPGVRTAAPRVLLAALLASLALLCLASPAQAHATLLSSDPAEGEVVASTPAEVTFTFDEPVSLPADGVQVFDAAGEPVEADGGTRDDVLTADLPDQLDDGTYVVVWRVVSADGHPIGGSLTFSIGSRSPEVVAPKVADDDSTGISRNVLSTTQAACYLGLLTAAGLAVFLALTVRGVRLDPRVRSRVERVQGGASALAIGGALLSVPASAAYQQGTGLPRAADLIDLSLVGGVLLTLALVAVGLPLALLGVRRQWATWQVLAPALLAVVGPALVGHSRTIEPIWLTMVTDVVHLSAGSVWLGGLVGLVLVLPALSGRERDSALVLTRFSTVAAGLVAVLAVTGTLLGWRILNDWGPLFGTTYGLLLLVKVGVAALTVAAAGYNRFRLLPAAVSGVGHDARRGGVLRVRDAVRVEAGLLVVVLLLTGFLTQNSPREAPVTREPVASRVETAIVGDLTVIASVAPPRSGPVTIAVQVQDATGEPVEGITPPTVRLRSGTVDLGSQAVRPIAAGTYEVSTVIPTSGVWTLEVALRPSTFDNPVVTLDLEVR